MKIIIPIGLKTGKNLENIAAENNGRIQNWRRGAATLDVVPTGKILAHNCGRYSSRCTYTKWEYTPVMTSFGVIDHGGTALRWQIGSDGGVMFAPRGFLFSSDSLGVKLCAAKNSQKDFHFSTDDIIFSENPIKNILAMARKNWAAQAEQRKIATAAKREAEIYAREIGSVRVTLDDSRRVGNCLEGTLGWCERKLGLSRKEILDGGYLFSQPASKVLAANGHEGVQRAVKFAWLRETCVSI